MKGQSSFVPSKKLILHFDIQSILTIPSPHPDLFVKILSFRSTNFAHHGSGDVSKRHPKRILTKSLDGRLQLTLSVPNAQRLNSYPTKNMLRNM